MTTTRPGYIWSGTEWIAIGQDAAVSPFSYQATAPSSPSTGDIWIDSDETVNSIDSTQFLRWRKTAVGAETSLSGNDDSSLLLTYTPGYEQVYINGVLMVRGVDYTATDGSTVTGLTALVANDVVEVFSAVARAVADVYTQSQIDSKLGNTTVANTAWSSTGLTTTNFSSTSYRWRVYNGVFYIQFYGIWSGGTITSDTTGNIADTTIVSIGSTYAPTSISLGVIFDIGGVGNGTGIIGNTGDIVMRSYGGASQSFLQTGRSVTFGASWCLV